MLDHKRIDYERVDLGPGLQPLLTCLLGFPGMTVPALRLDGRRIQGSVPIARALEAAKPEPPLYPREGSMRAAVEEASGVTGSFPGASVYSLDGGVQGVGWQLAAHMRTTPGAGSTASSG